MDRIILYGGGGTDFTTLFDYIREKKNDCLPSAIVIFTDGYGPFPVEEATLGIPVLWMIDNEDITPPFGKVARVLPDCAKRSV